MSASYQLFDAAGEPLTRGVSLIEASAGTGKTYTIAMLVLRLIAEQGLAIEQVLLVTFTRAATEELAQRIRQRLSEAAKLLTTSTPCGDATLNRWADNLEDREAALTRIRRALLDIDRASIFTIHGFCQRMLQELALESDQAFEVELEPDIVEVSLEIVRDFWRKEVYPLPAPVCAALLAYYPTPDSLYASVAPVSGHVGGIEPESGTFTGAREDFDHHLALLSSWWREFGAGLARRLGELVAEGKAKKNFSDSWQEWCADLGAYLAGGGALPKNLHWLERQGFRECINGSRVRGARQEELLDWLQLPEKQAEGVLAALEEMVLQLRCALARMLLAERERRLGRRGILSYDDLILRLRRALERPAGERLGEMLRQRFAAALIDEFQDTDMLQWRIFSSVFSSTTHFLYLIGDPKQAIYKFRGADIHTYFLARKAAAVITTLSHNYRSHPGLVEEINELFGGRRRPFGFAESKLPFTAVAPARGEEDERLLRDRTPCANMVYCQLPPAEGNSPVWTSGKAAEAVCAFVAGEIARLLDGSTEIAGAAGGRVLEPGDIAVLVRTHAQAERLQEHLVGAGVPAVLSSRQSVFATAECAELYRLLEALVEPGDERRVKRAMTVSWFGLSGNDLYRIWHDAQQLDGYLIRFREYGETWLLRGVLVMMNGLLAREKVLETLAEEVRAERKIANIHHLLELLQAAETENLYGPLQLLQWLRQNMAGSAEEDELRLESDRQAVRLVTMHGSKGLEYKIVFCPFLWYRQTRLDQERLRLLCHEDGELVLDLGSARFEERRERAAEDDFSEELRLTYVALTRAKLRCYAVWCDCRNSGAAALDSFASGLAYLLFPEGRVDHEAQRQRLVRQADGKRSAYLPAVPPAAAAPLPARSTAMTSFSCRKRNRGALSADYQLTSYSALAGAAEPAEPQQTESGEAGWEGPPLRFAGLPAGANFGNAVHDIFETQPFSRLSQKGAGLPSIEETCRRFGLDLDPRLLEEMLAAAVSAPIGLRAGAAQPFALADLEEGCCVKEMAFHFHLQGGSGEQVNDILRGEPTVQPIPESRLKGYLTGFVDLVFVHGGVYYIADYKTNALGRDIERYRPEALVEAMAAHNYGLQLWLYSLVLHRHLRNTLPGYDYGKHFGGAFYLFLRGMDRFPAGIYFHKPDRAGLERLHHCLGGSRG